MIQMLVGKLKHGYSAAITGCPMAGIGSFKVVLTGTYYASRMTVA